MHRLLKSLGFFPLSLFVLLFAGVTVLQACGGPSTTSSNGPATITVAYEQFGPPPYPEGAWWAKVKQRVEAANPNIKVKLEPIIADEGSYYTKLDLMMRSATTAPDLVREDSFLVSSDVTAGYLAPLDKYLAAWPEYSQQWFPAMQKITTFNGHNYGVMDGTDVRLIWYSKNIFQKAGLPTTWQPQNWADILSAARAIKAKVPGVIPINLYSGIPMDEASSMQGFEMLLYGTKNPLYNYSTQKWVASSPGFLDALNFVKQIYNPSNLLGPTNDIALSTQAANTRQQQLVFRRSSAVGAVAADDGCRQDADRIRAGSQLCHSLRRLGLLHYGQVDPSRPGIRGTQGRQQSGLIGNLRRCGRAGYTTPGYRQCTRVSRHPAEPVLHEPGGFHTIPPRFPGVSQDFAPDRRRYAACDERSVTL